jgi:hypothetical protein
MPSKSPFSKRGILKWMVGATLVVALQQLQSCLWPPSGRARPTQRLRGPNVSFPQHSDRGLKPTAIHGLPFQGILGSRSRTLLRNASQEALPSSCRPGTVWKPDLKPPFSKGGFRGIFKGLT